MNRTQNLMVAAAVTSLLSACSSTPDRIEQLEVARAIVSQVESSPRAGVAATNVSEARAALDRANQLYERGADVGDIEYAATVAARNAQIANEKILTAQAREEIEKGTSERQAVLIQAREAEARRSGRRAEASAEQAQLSEQRASTLEQELEELRANAKKTPRGIVLTLDDVLFETGMATLKPGAFSTIERVATVLKESSDRKVTIEGHTDSVGAADYNQELSQRRAAAVQTALLERGVPSDQITAIGKGEVFPVATNETPAGRQQNRRVELVFNDDASQVASDVN